MNNLQKLIRLRELTVKKVADKIGYGYHNVQKIIKRATRPTGEAYSNHDIEVAVAALLGLTHKQCWGDDSEMILKRLIRQEIAAKASETANQLRQIYL